MWYQIQAVIKTESDKGEGAVQIPTFYLNSEIQGIINIGHAKRVAKDVINPEGHYRDDQLEITAYLSWR